MSLVVDEESLKPLGDVSWLWSLLCLLTLMIGCLQGHPFFSWLAGSPHFLPARRYASLGICYGVSVCVSHACFVSKTAEHFVKILLRPDSPIILVFRHRGSLFNSDGFTPNGGAEYRGVRKLGNCLPISWCISETV